MAGRMSLLESAVILGVRRGYMHSHDNVLRHKVSGVQQERQLIMLMSRGSLCWSEDTVSDIFWLVDHSVGSCGVTLTLSPVYRVNYLARVSRDVAGYKSKESPLSPPLMPQLGQLPSVVGVRCLDRSIS